MWLEILVVQNFSDIKELEKIKHNFLGICVASDSSPQCHTEINGLYIDTIKNLTLLDLNLLQQINRKQKC